VRRARARARAVTGALIPTPVPTSVLTGTRSLSSWCRPRPGPQIDLPPTQSTSWVPFSSSRASQFNSTTSPPHHLTTSPHRHGAVSLVNTAHDHHPLQPSWSSKWINSGPVQPKRRSKSSGSPLNHRQKSQTHLSSPLSPRLRPLNPPLASAWVP
jgi:hypothetical protein